MSERSTGQSSLASGDLSTSERLSYMTAPEFAQEPRDSVLKAAVGSALCLDVKFDSDGQSIVSSSHHPVTPAAPVLGRMETVLRLKPLLDDEDNPSCLLQHGNDTIEAIPPPSSQFAKSRRGDKRTCRYTFSRVFPPSTSQQEMFFAVADPLVRNVVGGSNSLVFAYGVTNSGKTYTMHGGGGMDDGGILRRSVTSLFDRLDGKVSVDAVVKPHQASLFVRLSIAQQTEEHLVRHQLIKAAQDSVPPVAPLNLNSSSASQAFRPDSRMSVFSAAPSHRQTSSVGGRGGTEYMLWMSMVEIYNDQIYDLMQPPSENSGKLPPKKAALDLCTDGVGREKQTYIRDVRLVFVTSVEDVFLLLALGRRQLNVARTMLNTASSRSHCIFSLHVVAVDPSSAVRVSKLCVCDLAGQERLDRTKGCRQAETAKINSSLMTLKRCIGIIKYNQKFSQTKMLVPYRESKLTRVFQSFFDGFGLVRMVVTASQHPIEFDETNGALQFAAQAQTIDVRTGTRVEEARLDEALPSHICAVIKANRRRTEARQTIEWANGGPIVADDNSSSSGSRSVSPTEAQMTDLQQQLQQWKEHARDVKQRLRKAIEKNKTVREETAERYEGMMSTLRAANDVSSARNLSLMEAATEKRIQLHVEAVRQQNCDSDTSSMHTPTHSPDLTLEPEQTPMPEDHRAHIKIATLTAELEAAEEQLAAVTKLNADNEACLEDLAVQTTQNKEIIVAKDLLIVAQDLLIVQLRQEIADNDECTILAETARVGKDRSARTKRLSSKNATPIPAAILPILEDNSVEDVYMHASLRKDTSSGASSMHAPIPPHGPSPRVTRSRKRIMAKRLDDTCGTTDGEEEELENRVDTTVKLIAKRAARPPKYAT